MGSIKLPNTIESFSFGVHNMTRASGINCDYLGAVCDRSLIRLLIVEHFLAFELRN